MNKDVSSQRLWRHGRGSDQLEPAERHAAALSMLVARRSLRGTLPADFIHDPALEMLLSLYLARPVPMDLADLAAETTVPRKVAARWFEALRTEGLVAAIGDFTALTNAGLAAVENMLDAVVASQRDMLGWGDQ